MTNLKQILEMSSQFLCTKISDTEDASETDMAKLEEEFSELKEQLVFSRLKFVQLQCTSALMIFLFSRVYQEKLNKYKKQLQELNNGKNS